MDLEFRQHSYAKGLGQCQLIEKPSACKFETLSDTSFKKPLSSLQHDHCGAVVFNL
jgi:hypothetical protein